MDEREELAEVLGCKFNPWGECQTHETPSVPSGYDERYCPTVEAVIEWLAERGTTTCPSCGRASGVIPGLAP